MQELWHIFTTATYFALY